MRKFVASVALTTAFVFGTALGALPAKANTYNFSYETAGDQYFGSGTFTTGAAGSPFTVTGITGTSNGSAITGLFVWNSADQLLYYPASLVTITGNEIPPTFFDISGIGWQTADGDLWNLGNYFAFGGNAIGDQNVTGGNGIALVELSVSQTPLPSTWTMLIAAFAGFGFLAYRSAKKGSAALAAA